MNVPLLLVAFILGSSELGADSFELGLDLRVLFALVLGKALSQLFVRLFECDLGALVLLGARLFKRKLGLGFVELRIEARASPARGALGAQVQRTNPAEEYFLSNTLDYSRLACLLTALTPRRPPFGRRRPLPW